VHRQKGVALLELAVAVAIAAMLAIWTASLLVNRAEDARAEAAGRWLLAIRSAAIDMMLAQFDALAGIGTAPPGYADPHAPTLAELRQGGHLAADFPLLSPFGQPAQVRILTGAGCPGEGCRPDVLVTTLAAPPGADAADPAAMGQVLMATQGYGGAVHAQSPEKLRGALFDLPNPLAGSSVAHPVGTVAVHGGGEAGLHARFVRLRDRRDPDLQGGLSIRQGIQVGGDVTADGNVTAAGALTGGTLGLQGSAVPGSACAAPGLFSRTASGALLSCQAGRWRANEGGFGGAYAITNNNGCRNEYGVSLANPRTGKCSCPPGYAAVVVSEGRMFSEELSFIRGYVCVG